MKAKSLVAKALLVLVAAFLAFGTTACGTLHGAGQDIETAGEAIQEGAEDAAN